MFERHAIFLSLSVPLLYPRGGWLPGPGQGRPSCVFQCPSSLANLANICVYFVWSILVHLDMTRQPNGQWSAFTDRMKKNFKGRIRSATAAVSGQILGSG